MLQTINGIDLLLVLVITALGYYCQTMNSAIERIRERHVSYLDLGCGNSCCPPRDIPQCNWCETNYPCRVIKDLGGEAF